MESIFYKRRGFERVAQEVFGVRRFVMEKGWGKVLTKI
jgi:hypothetical protein